MKGNLNFKKFTVSVLVMSLLVGCFASYEPDEFASGEYYYGGYAKESAYNGNDENAEGTGDKFEEIKDNPFIKTADENVSTFSLDADSAAYSYMRRMLTNGRLPDVNSVRIEEYINYFTFDYADPTGDATVSLNSEISSCPWNNDHYLVRLVDSMNPQDRVSIVTYSGKEELLLESTLVESKDLIKSKINKLVASGATSGASAIRMAYNQANQHYIEGGNNRIIMGTDGDFNVGLTGTPLLEMVESYAHQEKSIYLTVCGFGSGNWNDAMMEKMSNKGNGTYVYVDSEEEMNKVFVEETSRFISVANDCKAQITFDKNLVAEYRLIGYENRVLNNEDFENDDVDAAEVGAGQTITALYEIIPTADCTYDATSKAFAAPLFTFDFRYKKDLQAGSKLISSDPAVFSETCSENMRFAQTVAAYGMILRNSPYKGNVSFSMLLDLIGSGFDFDPYSRRAKFVELVRKAKELSKE